MEQKDIYRKYVQKPLAIIALTGAIYFGAVGTEYQKSYSRDTNGNLIPITIEYKTFMKNMNSSAKTVNHELADIVKHPQRILFDD